MYNWELTDDALKTWMRLRQVFEAVEKVLQKQLDRKDATTAQVDMLSVLDASKVAVTPGQLAHYIFREQHSVSAQLSRMRKTGLITKRRGQRDQRVVKINIQPKGAELLKETGGVIGQAGGLLKSSLSDSEIWQLDKLLKKVRDRALKELGAEAEPLPNNFDVARFEALYSLAGRR